MQSTQPRNPYYLASWSPDTGTHELPRVHRGLPVGDLPTTELPFWLPRPTVPTRHDRRPPLARAARRLARSAVAADVRAGVHRGLAVMGAFGVAIALVVLVRGAYVACELFGLIP